MADTMSKAERSRRMAMVRGKNMKPEVAVRKLVHGLGYRYRLHKKDLPGTPDMVFKSKKKVIFVHGCFWHRHDNCKLARLPKSRLDFWKTKLEGNKKRDEENQKRLNEMGWEYLVIWECEVKDKQNMRDKIQSFLDRGKRAEK